jgi:hypothetical protein
MAGSRSGLQHARRSEHIAPVRQHEQHLPGAPVMCMRCIVLGLRLAGSWVAVVIVVADSAAESAAAAHGGCHSQRPLISLLAALLGHLHTYSSLLQAGVC